MFLLSLTATCQVCTVALKAGQSTYKGCAADAEKPTLCSGFPARLTPSVDMTSDVKSWVEIRSTFSSFLLFPERYCPSEEPEPVKYDG
jgi:hypothetical protein